MSIKKTHRMMLVALAAALSPLFLVQPAAAEGDYADYRYRTTLATETEAEKAARTGAQRQTVRVGSEDAAVSQRGTEPRRNHFYFDVAPEDEQHYRE